MPYMGCVGRIRMMCEFVYMVCRGVNVCGILWATAWVYECV